MTFFQLSLCVELGLEPCTYALLAYFGCFPTSTHCMVASCIVRGFPDALKVKSFLVFGCEGGVSLFVHSDYSAIAYSKSSFPAKAQSLELCSRL